MGSRGLFLGALLLLCSCAQVKEITGGEKDVAAPVLVSAIPPNGSVHFRSAVIRLEFNERIQLDRVRDRLLISPPMDAPPVVGVAGARSVEIRLEAPLKENTTYSFNLGECVKDLAEGNTAPGLTYVFSTGDALDSLQVTGTVMNAFTGVPEKDMLVLLHEAKDTADFRTGRPGYMTRCDGLGMFSIGNLPAGSYLMRALHDKNSNFRYDLPNEEIAFLDTALVLSSKDSIPPVVPMRAFLPITPEQHVRGGKVTADGAWQIVFARPVETLAVVDLARSGGVLTWGEEWCETMDTVLLWPSDTTLLIEGNYQFSAAGLVIDTMRYRPVQRMPFNMGLQATLREDAGGSFIRLRTARPIRDLDTTRIQLYRDTIPLPYQVRRDTSDERTIRLLTELPAGASAQLTLLPKAIRDIYGGTNDTLRAPLGRAAEQATGTLRVNVTGPRPAMGSYLLHLLDAQQRVIAWSRLTDEDPTVLWQRLAPGRSTLRLIADSNDNGRWDTGEWNSRLQPERTWHHPDGVNVRAAWDVVVDWKLE